MITSSIPWSWLLGSNIKYSEHASSIYQAENWELLPGPPSTSEPVFGIIWPNRQNDKYIDGIWDFTALREAGLAKIWARVAGFFACLSGIREIVTSQKAFPGSSAQSESTRRALSGVFLVNRSQQLSNWNCFSVLVTMWCHVTYRTCAVHSLCITSTTEEHENTVHLRKHTTCEVVSSYCNGTLENVKSRNGFTSTTNGPQGTIAAKTSFMQFVGEWSRDGWIKTLTNWVQDSPLSQRFA